jgi:GT2 family glycosyltransferase
MLNKIFSKIRQETGFYEAEKYFDYDWYQKNYGLTPGFDASDAFSHFMNTGWKMGFDPNPYFDTDWYLQQYELSDSVSINPLLHFINIGALERNKPSLFFDTSWYLDQHPDVLQAGINPFLHFLPYGRNEGRLAMKSAVIKEIDSVLMNESLSDMASDYKFDPSLVAILIPVFNNWSLTEICLRSLLANPETKNVQIFVLDDASTDSTINQLKRFESVKVIECEENSGFTLAVNSGFKYLVESGFEYIYLLNNDTFVLPGFLASALELIESNPLIAMVGSKLLNLDGTLQECGGIVWSDGSGANFGRNSSNENSIYQFSRPVDYCSGAALLIESQALKEVDYFDEIYAPAYYEDTDLAFKLRDIGREVWVSSSSEVIHFEGGSHGTDLKSGIKATQELNRVKFSEKWHQKLEFHLSNSQINLLRGAFRLLSDSNGAVIWIDDLFPDVTRDSGSVRAYGLLKIARNLEPLTVFVATQDNWDVKSGKVIRNLGQPAARSVEDATHMLLGLNIEPRFIWASRITSAIKSVSAIFEFFPNAPLIFDTVDLHFLRLNRQLNERDSEEDRNHQSRVEKQELAMMAYAHKTVVVSEFEQKFLMENYKISNTVLISNIHENTSDLPRFSQTDGVVFVGGFNHWPNTNGIAWFVSEVWPLVKSEIRECGLNIIGSNVPDEVSRLQNSEIFVHGWVPDSKKYVRSSRVSIAPLLVGAGVKGKVGEALSQGIPVIGTSIATEGMGFENNTHGLVANTPNEFAEAVNLLYESEQLWQKFQESGLALIKERFSFEKAQTSFLEMVEKL